MGNFITTLETLRYRQRFLKLQLKECNDSLIDGKEIIKIKTKATHIRILRLSLYDFDILTKDGTKR